MNKQDLAMYLVNLLGIMGSKETAGRARGNTIAEEYNRGYDHLMEMIRKDHEDETGFVSHD